MSTALLPDRIRTKVSVDSATGCWLWTACKGPKGYGQLWWDGRLHRSHRVVYTLMVGPIPDGLTLDHLCRVTACCNPEHLEPVTVAENVRRYWGTAPDLCRRGHELAGHNVIWQGPEGSRRRRCRECQYASHRAYRARISAA